VRLSSDGKTVLSVTRVADSVLDCAIDSLDNIYLAAANQGAIKLDPSAATLVYKRAVGGFCYRIDAGSDGTVAALNATGGNAGSIYVYKENGDSIGYMPGYQMTQDVAISSSLRSVFFLGFQNKNSGCNPVQVAYIKSNAYNGTLKWKDYDWPGNMLDNCNSAPYVNNMADTRGYRLNIGRDGVLCCAFECAGGNHIFRYDPADLSISVKVVGGDMYHNWSNTKSEHKTFFSRINASTGAYIIGQQFCTRVWNATANRYDGNAARVNGGAITTDESGNVYIAGPSASGLPIPGWRGYTPKAGQDAYNPFDSTIYTDGAYLLVMDSALALRRYCTRLTGNTTQAIDARIVNGKRMIAFGGKAGKLNRWLLDLRNAFQPAIGDTTGEGFVAVMIDDLAPGAAVRTPPQYGSGWNGFSRYPLSRLMAADRIAAAYDLRGCVMYDRSSTAMGSGVYLLKLRDSGQVYRRCIYESTY
jgi:hypothetical protein